MARRIFLCALMACLAIIVFQRISGSPASLSSPAERLTAAPPSAGHSSPAVKVAAPLRRSTARKSGRPSVDRLPSVAAPIVAEANDGATPFILRDRDVNVFFGNEGVALALASRDSRRGWGLHWKLEGARAVAPVAGPALETRIHHLDAAGARSSTVVAGVVYPDVRPGVDLKLESQPGGVKYTLEAEAGADMSRLAFDYEGAEAVDVAADGRSVEIRTGLGVLQEDTLYCYQEIDGRRHEVPARYVPDGDVGYRIELGVYDASLPLTVDPVIRWSTFLGGDLGHETSGESGTAVDMPAGVAVDAAGVIYVVGITQSLDFPTGGSFSPASAGKKDAYVAAISSGGDRLLWGAYLGGINSDQAHDVAVDDAGFVYVVGHADFGFPFTVPISETQRVFLAKIQVDGSRLLWAKPLPASRLYHMAYDGRGGLVLCGVGNIAQGGFDTTQNKTDAFVLKVDLEGTPLWSTFLGGGEQDVATDLAVDGNGDIYVVGETRSYDFPAFGPGAVSSRPVSDLPVNFLAKIASSGARLLWSTYLPKGGTSVAVDGSGFAYVAGTILVDGGKTDALVQKLGPDGPLPVWERQIGGSSDELDLRVRSDASGSLVLAGRTLSTDLPLLNAFDVARGPETEGEMFVSRLTTAGGLVSVSYLGGSLGEGWPRVAMDRSGNGIVVGYTGSSDLPGTGGFDRSLGVVDTFVAKVGPAGQLLWTTYLGGAHGFSNDEGSDIALDAAGNIVVVGQTTSVDFPTPGGFQRDLSGARDVFVSKLSGDGARLLWSTYLGGSGEEFARAVTVDAADSVYVGGYSLSTDFPVKNASGFLSGQGSPRGYLTKIASSGSEILWSARTASVGDLQVRGSHVYGIGHEAKPDGLAIVGGFDTTPGGQDAYLFKATLDGRLAWSSFLGGSGAERGLAITLDAANNMFVAGTTRSSDFPVVGGFDGTYAGRDDVFVAKIPAAGTSIAWSTLMGDIWDDVPTCITVDAQGNVYVGGTTESDRFPIVDGFQPNFHYGSPPPGVDGFLAKISPTGNQLLYSTYLGSYWDDRVSGIAVDAAGRITVAGYAPGTSLFLLNEFSRQGTGFVVQLDAAGRPLWSSRAGNDTAAMAVDGAGRLYLAGTARGGVTATTGAYDTTYSRLSDAFIVRVDPASTPVVVIHTPTTQDQWKLYASSVSLAGSVSATGTITSVTWSNAATGQTGTTTGTSSWSAVVPLAPGENPITVTAMDGSGSGSDTLTVTYRAVETITFVPRKSTWRFYDRGKPPVQVIPGNDNTQPWRSLLYDDSTWASGPGVLGYGESYVATPVSYGSDPNQKPLTTYFRKRFHAGNPRELQSLTLHLMCDDGAAVQISYGTYVQTFNLPPSFDHWTPASRNGEAYNRYETFDVSFMIGDLKVGENVICVEVHQVAPSSSDMVFDAELVGVGPVDAAPPAVTIVNPKTSAVIAGTTIFEAQASDDVHVSKVEYRVGGSLVGTATAPPWRVNWDSATVSDGLHTLSVKAFDGSGKTSSSAPVSFTVQNGAQPPSTVGLIPKYSVWLYHERGIDLGTAWRAPAYDDRAWTAGPGPLGYGEPYIRTLLSYGADPNNKPLTVYFRKEFNVDDPRLVTKLLARVMYDDGFVLYVNGVEVRRAALPTGTISFSTKSQGHEANNVHDVFDLAAALPHLVAGRNVVAVELHQQAASSSDLVFDLELEAQQGGGGDAVAPTVSIVSPTAGQVVQGTVSITAEAADNVGVTKVELYVDDVLIGTSTTAPYSAAWFTHPGTTWRPPDGPHRLRAKAYDAMGNVGTSAEVVVQLDNPDIVRVTVGAGADWNYYGGGSDLGTAWREQGYDDQGWKAGVGPLGYGDRGLKTIIDYGSDPSAKPITTYFRKQFSLSDYPNARTLTAKVLYDDGFVFYINGKEVQRASMPSGTITASTRANGHEASAYETFDLTPHLSTLGLMNTLAVEVHQTAASSSDLVFDLSLEIGF